ncbi:MAG: DUF4296 domain-containing protein [Paludibacteraceae bacterium]
MKMVWKNSLHLTILAILLFGVFTSSCNSRPKGVLSPNEMENLMVDMHMLEGSLRASGYEYAQEEKKNEYYLALLTKYNISPAEFDSCLSWYTKSPKQFDRIYTNVLARIDTLRSDVERGKFYPVDSTIQSGLVNLWKQPIKFRFTKDSARNQLYFEIKDEQFLANDLYELSFLHRLSPTDSSYKPHAVMYVNYLNGYIDSIYTKTKNDNVFRRYTLKFRARKNLKIKSISGYLLGNDSVKGKMNAYIDSVKLTRRFNPYKQDSIRSAIFKLDSTEIKSDTMARQPDSIPRKQLIKESDRLQTMDKIQEIQK